MKDFKDFTFEDFKERIVAPQHEVVGSRFVVTHFQVNNVNLYQ